MPHETQASAGDKFPVTRWSVIDAARGSQAEERERALATLFAAYWRPIYKYIRLRWNRPPDDAEDLTQGFFVELLERDLLAHYDPAKSRLRTFLRICADSFVMNEHKAARREKRGGNILHVSLDFPHAEGELRARLLAPAQIASRDSIEEFFEKEWIRSLFTLAIGDLRALCDQRRKQRAFLLFEEYDLDGELDASYDQLARRHGIPVTEVTNSLAWARREFRRIALDRLREICGNYEEFEREVVAVFGKNSRYAR